MIKFCAVLAVPMTLLLALSIAPAPAAAPRPVAQEPEGGGDTQAAEATRETEGAADLEEALEPAEEQESEEAETDGGTSGAGAGSAAGESPPGGQATTSTSPGPGADVTADAGSTAPPVRVGRTAPLAFGQACYASWQDCHRGVQGAFEAMWNAHRERRRICDDALKGAEADCLDVPRPGRCARPARREWKRCGWKADRDQRRKGAQIDQQWQACAQAYQNCVSRPGEPHWW